MDVRRSGRPRTSRMPRVVPRHDGADGAETIVALRAAACGTGLRVEFAERWAIHQCWYPERRPWALIHILDDAPGCQSSASAKHGRPASLFRALSVSPGSPSCRPCVAAAASVGASHQPDDPATTACVASAADDKSFAMGASCASARSPFQPRQPELSAPILSLISMSGRH